MDVVGLYLSLGAMAVLAAGRPLGGRWFAPIVGVAAALTGVAGVVLPDATGSAGRLGGAVLIVGGSTFAMVALRSASSRPATALPTTAGAAETRWAPDSTVETRGG